MKFRICLLATLVLVIAGTCYVSGRWACDPLMLFMGVPTLLLSFVVSLMLLAPRNGDSSRWNSWQARYGALALAWLFLALPTFAGDGYFEMGRRAHIRSLFSPELVAEVRATAAELSARKSKWGMVELTPEDLPVAVGSTPWGFPGYASCTFNTDNSLASIALIWGGALISHHGLIVSDESIPFHGEGYHGPDVDGRTVVEYPRRYFPLYPGVYILIDDH